MRVLLACLLWLWPTLIMAQVPATLIADSVTVTGNDRLRASGNVEVFFEGTRLTAGAISYNRVTDRLDIAGPIVIRDADGNVLAADRATLDPQLENGMLLGARLVLDQRLQLAAARLDRADGRYSQLTRSVMTSCSVCGNRPPLWDIRAERIVHDAAEQQLYLTNAQLRVRGVPLIWLPRMRLPDPTLDRATGLLRPRLRTTTLLGSGLKLPYFITLGPHRDLTLTPYWSPNTRTLEARYRQAFSTGAIQIEAAVSDDDLLPGERRGYVFAEGVFALPDAYILSFDIEATSDDAYLLDYGYSDKDRLDTAISLTRVTQTERFDAAFTYYQTLRADEQNASLPPIVADLRYDRRFAVLGGALTLAASGDAIIRYGDGTGDAGRDMTRAGLRADWTRSWIAPIGLMTTANLGLGADWYRIGDDPTQPRDATRATSDTAVTLRYPLTKQTANASHLIEPIAMLSWSEVAGDTPPNEDSRRPEFDPANLLALSRFPGDDALETGARAAVGLAYTRVGRGGSLVSLTAGRISRQDPNPDFTVSSGNRGQTSDWLVAGQVLLPQGLRVEARTLWDVDFEPNLAQALLDWETDTLRLGAAYIWQAPDEDVGRDSVISEWSLDGRVQLNDAWAVSFDTRYDIVADAPARAGLGVEWRNECVTVDLSVSRRYTSSTTVDPATDYGLSVTLAGFSTADTVGRPLARCQK